MLRSSVPLGARIIRGVVAALIVLVSVGVAWLLVMTRPEPVRTPHGEGVPRVQVFSAVRAPVARPWRGWGVADALVRADVPARVTATVAAIPRRIQAGVSVARDELLVELDDSDFRREAEIARHRLAEIDAALRQIQVEHERLAERLAIERENLALATSERQRVEKLFKDKVANQQDFDSVRRSELTALATLNLTTETNERIAPRRAALEAQKQGQYSTLQLAELNMQRCRITSPIDGVLQSVDVKLGESVSSGQRVARVIDLSRVEVPVQLPVAAQQDLAAGDPVTLTAANGSGCAWRARLTRLAPESDAQARTMTVYAEVEQADAAAQFGVDRAAVLLRPGTFVEAVVTSRLIEHRFVVPRRAVRAGRIMVADDGIVHSRPVRIDFVVEGKLAQLPALPDDQWAVIDDAIREGEQVLVTPTATLLDGARVAAVPISAAEVAAKRIEPEDATEVQR